MERKSPLSAEEHRPPTTSPCCGHDPGTDAFTELADAHLRTALAVPVASEADRADLRARLRPIPGGFFEMGARVSRFPGDHDAPRRRVKLSDYAIAPCAVSNEDYARFVSATGYATVAERLGWSFVFAGFLGPRADRHPTPPGLPWWRAVEGATWCAPEGPGSRLEGRERHPVAHMAWYDALAYCRWAGLVLPTEAQWERAARGGLERKKFPWGNSREPGGRHAMNIWRGDFPDLNTAEDGHVGTAPVDAFEPNGFGLHNTTGNVWEWVADIGGARPSARAGLVPLDPTGPTEGSTRVARGGSHLCHDSYCDRYFVHSRVSNAPDSSTGHMGFRVAAPPGPAAGVVRKRT